MAGLQKRLYKGRIVLNVLANSIENAEELFDAAEGHVLVGVLSKNYAAAEEAAEDMKRYGERIEDAVSIGLGGGDSRQANVVAEIARIYEGSHINQVFPAVGMTRANLGKRDSWINSLVSPTGRAGYVNLSTGPISQSEPEQAIVPVAAAIAIVKDMGGNALKYFPMGGLRAEDEYRAVAEACAKADFALEPTGGIDPGNFETIIQIALEAGVPCVIPHVYTSIIDRDSGKTKTEDVRELTRCMKRAVDRYV